MMHLSKRGMAALVVACAAAMMVPGVSYAYQTVRVGSGGAIIFAQPNREANAVANVNPGTVLNIGDRPTNGFYRCSGAHKVSGWVSEDDIILKNKPASRQAQRSGGTAGAGPAGGNYVGLLGGLTLVSSTTDFSFGADANFKLNENLGFGAYVTYTSIASASESGTDAATGASASASGGVHMIVISPELNYFFGGNLKGLHADAKLGIALLSVSSSVTTSGLPTGVTIPDSSVSASSFGIAFGGGAGYDYMLGSSGFSVGGEANFLLVTSSGAGTTIDFLAAAKYWF